ncbi:hypothetical protein A5819_000043 [Enterococcus sp. 7E2_DIV0204]|uniref:hypothetical protein n=1 Tax=unclassified Enterococcus TaxID=2608891 RepID=UPI000A354C41|nr:MULTISPECIES: hypothetical protein [unclassified Enterococcus]OTN87597.1 hypothetical protein A5819_000043 [Enterococcus sp. 7E2_DIV0204]OTP49717.1 hypothetical protein A5884_002917 [Enterococcus sp. 7D2_DIV0200]
MEPLHSETEILKLVEQRKLLEKLPFDDMPKKFREHRNFLKLAAVLVDYGYMCSWLPVDNEGADFIAVHCKTNDVFKIQLKGRITVDKKYYGKGILIAFPKSNREPLKNWIIVPHDELSTIYRQESPLEENRTKSSTIVSNKIWEAVKKISIIEPTNLN